MSADIWSKAKSEGFRDEFLAFLANVTINSKESGPTCLGDNVFGSQTRMLDAIFEGLEDGIHDFKFLKSRQLGCSTFARAFALFWLGVHDGLQGALILDSDSNKEAARAEIMSMIQNLPAHIKFPRVKSQNRYGITLENGSRLNFLAAGNKKGQTNNSLGASLGLNFIIASEMCKWGNQDGVESLRPSLSKTFPNRLYIWESTARGPNLWKTMWEEAESDDITQRTEFLGWWSRTDQRIKRGTALYKKYGTDDPTDKELERIAQVRELYDVDIDDEQLAWIRHTNDPEQKLEDGDLEDPTRLQEQPWTAEDAFQITGSTFFSPAKLSQCMASASPDFQSYKFFHGTDFFHTTVERSRSLRDTQLKVWEEPIANSTYVVAADPAFGHDEKNNNSAIQVLRCFADRVEQVAEFADSSTPTSQFAWVIAALCGWYGVGPHGTFTNQVEVIIEINGPGEAVLNEFRGLKSVVESPHLRKEASERGLKNIFQNVRNYLYARSDSYGTGNSLHWKTTGQLKEAIFERLRDFINSETLVIRSMAILQEMKDVVRDGSSIGAPGMQRDDRTFSMAMGIRAWEDKLRRRMLSEGRTKQRDEEQRRVTPADKFAIFNRHQLETFFQRKKMARISAARAESYKRWRYK